MLNAQLVRLRLLSIRACAKLTKTLRVRAYARTLGFDAAKIALGFAEARLCSRTQKPASRSLSSWYARKIYRKPKSRFSLSVTKRKGARTILWSLPFSQCSAPRFWRFDAAKIALGFAEARLCSRTKKPANRKPAFDCAEQSNGTRRPKARKPQSKQLVQNLPKAKVKVFAFCY